VNYPTLLAHGLHRSLLEGGASCFYDALSIHKELPDELNNRCEGHCEKHTHRHMITVFLEDLCAI
jgi:hypothetical protein